MENWESKEEYSETSAQHLKSRPDHRSDRTGATSLSIQMQEGGSRRLPTHDFLFCLGVTSEFDAGLLRQNDAVDDVDHTVAGVNVSGNDIGSVDHDSLV